MRCSFEVIAAQLACGVHAQGAPAWGPAIVCVSCRVEQDIRQVWTRVEGWMRWSSGGCETLLGPSTMSLTRVPWTLAKSLAGDGNHLRRAGQPSAAPPTLSGSRGIRRNRGVSIFKVLGRLWVPLVILAVVVAGGFTVSRLHGIFGSEKQLSYADTRVDDGKPFNPKHIRYEVSGEPGAVADISYFDVNGEPQHLKGASLPWSLEFAVSSATTVGNVVAQGDGDSIGCRILVDDVVKAEKTSHETALCLLPAEGSMSEPHMRNEQAAAICAADDPSIFSAHYFGLGGARRNIGVAVPPLEQVEKEHSYRWIPTMRRRSRR